MNDRITSPASPSAKPSAEDAKLLERFRRYFYKEFTYRQPTSIIGRNGKSMSGPIYYDDFDYFADELAHGLRHVLYYRTDDGKYARGLVRGSGMLRKIHNAYKEISQQGYPKHGQQIKLQVFVLRRAQPDPESRWALAIHYHTSEVAVIQGDNMRVDPVEGSEWLKEEQCFIFKQALSLAYSNLDTLSQRVNREDTRNLILFLQSKNCFHARRAWHFNATLWNRYTEDWQLIGPDTRDALVAGKGWPMDGHANNLPWRTRFAERLFTKWGALEGRWDSPSSARMVTTDIGAVAYTMRAQIDRARTAQFMVNNFKKFDSFLFVDKSQAIGKSLESVLREFRKLRGIDSYAYSAFRKLQNE